MRRGVASASVSAWMEKRRTGGRSPGGLRSPSPDEGLTCFLLPGYFPRRSDSAVFIASLSSTFFLCLFRFYLFYFFFKDFRQTPGIDSSHFKGPLLGWSSQGCTRPLDPTVIERSLSGGGGGGGSSLSDGIALYPPRPPPRQLMAIMPD